MATSKIKIEKKCEWCGQVFLAQKATTKFCSKRCAEHAYKEQLRQTRVKITQTAIAVEDEEKKVSPLKDKEYMTPKEVGVLLGVDKLTVYRYLWDGILGCLQLRGRTFIRRSDIDKMFETTSYTKRHKSSSPSVEDWYTTKEIIEKFGVSNSWVFKVAKEKNIPKAKKFGRTYWSKSHCDRAFAKPTADPEITEWYTAEEMKEKF